MNFRVFISNIVPRNQIEKLNVSAAANYFSYNLIDNNCFDFTISMVPTNINYKIKCRSKIDYVQTRFFKNNGITKLFNLIIDNIKVFVKVNSKSNLWYYNLTYQNILVYLLIKYLKPSVNQFIIVLDFTPTKSSFSLQNFLFNQINSCDGLISLTNNNKLTHKNISVIPGIIPNDHSAKKHLKVTNSFLLSGILSQNRCPQLILEAFSRFSEYELIITGKIEDQSLIDRYVSRFENIKYLGFLKYEEYIKVLESSTFSINSRDPAFKENHFNFPSKTIEHIKHNKIIISTMEYTELDKINYFFVKPNIIDFSNFLKSLKTMKKKDLLNIYANQSSKVIKSFGITKWKNTFEQIEKKIKNENFNK